MLNHASLPPGTVVGRFTVEELIGAGGMGEVYAARDGQLGRRVALKILPSSRSAERDRVERFLREARAASSLNHPAIVTIFDSGSEDSIHYLAMELIEGETLTQWTRGGRNRDKIVPVLAQVAEGLARAHAGGIVHRDLKPDNIMVARGGYAKIVDFGVAKLTERAPIDGVSPNDTAPSAMLGTASFMSPEQVEGRAVDHRSDVFSFGCVMYAAFQGRAPFERDSVVKTMNAVVNDPPPRLTGVPPAIERIARRCVAKDPEERYQSIKDVALDLREISADDHVHAAGARRLWLVGTTVVAIVIAIGSWIATQGDRAIQPASIASSRGTAQMSMVRLTNSGKIGTGAITPDGKYLVYCSLDGDKETMWVKQIATGTDVRILPPADGFYNDVRVSPDSNYVLYAYAPRTNPNIVDVYETPILGGETRKVATDIDGGIAVSPDGHRLAFRRFTAVDRVSRIFVADLDTGVEHVVLQKRFPDIIGDSPTFTPDGKRLTVVLGNLRSKTMERSAILSIADLDLDTGHLIRIPTPPWPGVGRIEWLPDGSGMLLTVADRLQPPQIWLLPYPQGTPRKITSDLSHYIAVSVTSDSKTLAVQRYDVSANLWLVDRGAKARPLTTGTSNSNGANGLAWMPDGKVLYNTFIRGTPTLRVIDAVSGDSHELLRDGGFEPAVSPDGKTIAFTSYGSGAVGQLCLIDINGSALRQITTSAPANYASWFPDSKSVAYVSWGEVQAIWRIGIDSQNETRLTDRPANSPRVSPDGNWLLCRLRAADSRTVPLWRTAIVPIGKNGETRYYDVPRSAGPHRMQWLPDGRSFAFLDDTAGVTNIWVQDVRGGAPRQITHFDSGQIYAYDIGRDGRIAVSHGEPVNDMVLIRDFR